MCEETPLMTPKSEWLDRVNPIEATETGPASDVPATAITSQ